MESPPAPFFSETLGAGLRLFLRALMLLLGLRDRRRAAEVRAVLDSFDDMQRELNALYALFQAGALRPPPGRRDAAAATAHARTMARTMTRHASARGAKRARQAARDELRRAISRLLDRTCAPETPPTSPPHRTPSRQPPAKPPPPRPCGPADRT